MHIINTIGSIDDLIDNYNKTIDAINSIGDLKIKLYKEWNLNDEIQYKKGKEIGSKNYIDKFQKDLINYIRVGDLLSDSSSVYVEDNNLEKCNLDDILISFDGAPGRIGICKRGSYSSGVRKVICNNDLKGLVYFSLRSDKNQNIIKTNSVGTTILHASKSIDKLLYPRVGNDALNYFNLLFDYLINLKIKVIKLKSIKNNLLNKYFSTNQ